tara:strand:+ start:4251 stop:4547 length:297 start_codon:yes stop_codon:yes gene_type:complete
MEVNYNKTLKRLRFIVFRHLLILNHEPHGYGNKNKRRLRNIINSYFDDYAKLLGLTLDDEVPGDEDILTVDQISEDILEEWEAFKRTKIWKVLDMEKD